MKTLAQSLLAALLAYLVVGGIVYLSLLADGDDFGALLEGFFLAGPAAALTAFLGVLCYKLTRIPSLPPRPAEPGPDAPAALPRAHVVRAPARAADATVVRRGG